MSQPFDDLSDLFDGLRARASEFGAIPAFRLSDDPKKLASVFVGLQQEPDKPGLGLLVIHESPESQIRFVVELEGLRGLLDRPL
jgi:hypothetical protein